MIDVMWAWNGFFANLWLISAIRIFVYPHFDRWLDTYRVIHKYAWDDFFDMKPTYDTFPLTVIGAIYVIGVLFIWLLV